jgi:TatD DNase family protein
MLVDSHAHLDMPDFDDDLKEVITRAKKNGIEHIITVASDYQSNLKGLDISKRFKNVYATIGIHPHDAKDANEKKYNDLTALAKESKVVAWGEIGLDYYRDYCPKEIQQREFIKQLHIAKDLNLPVVVHSRDAESDILKIIKKEYSSDRGGVIHCFSGDRKLAREFLNQGFYISIAGPVTYKNARQLQEVARQIPTERLLVETDCPFLAPEPVRGKRNEPSFVKYTAEKIAQLKRLSLEDIGRIVTLNSYSLFGIGKNDQKEKITYKIRNSLYINVTNRCTNNCVFCSKNEDPYVKGHNLRLYQDPSIEEILRAVGDPAKYDEVVFCGYGEPLLRLDVVKEVAKKLKEKKVKTRLNTNGQGNLIHKRNILPELKGLIDSISISLNAESSQKYYELCRPQFHNGTYEEVKGFVIEAKKHIPEVRVSIVDMPSEIDIRACEKIAEKELGVPLRKRLYNVVG